VKPGRLQIISGTLAVVVAIAAGHFVQSSFRAERARLSDGESTERREAPGPGPVIRRNEIRDVTLLSSGARRPADAPAMPRPPAAARAPGVLSLPERTPPPDAVAGNSRWQPTAGAERYNQYGLPCETALNAAPAAAGMVRLEVVARCRPGAVVEITHDRLSFAARLGADGTRTIAVPAMAERAAFVAALADGTVLTTVARQPEAAGLDRVALQWQGHTGMHLHAYEGGAGFGDPGHVWASAPGTPKAAQAGRRGFLSVLGDPDLARPRMAEVYTYPRGRGTPEGGTEIAVEVEVTEANCGHQIAGETLLRTGDGAVRTTGLSLEVPGCAAVGEFLLLQNVLRDMKLAAR